MAAWGLALRGEVAAPVAVREDQGITGCVGPAGDFGVGIEQRSRGMPTADAFFVVAVDVAHRLVVGAALAAGR